MSPGRVLTGKLEWVPSAVPLFLFGFVYYLVSPFFVLRFLSDESDLLYVATRYLELSHFDLAYALDATAILVSFLVGYSLAKAATRARTSVLDFGAFQTSVPLALAAMFCVLIVYFGITADASGAGFFTGYSSYNILVLGPFSTCAFMSAWFVNYFSNKQVRFLFFAFFVLCSALLLGWGARMFFVLSFTALVLGLVFKNRALLRSPRFYAVIVIFCLFTVGVGIVREGGRELSADRLLAVFFAEPLFTSISGALYLENSGGRPAYGVPRDLLASFIHFIPSAVYPEKIDLMSEITYNENIESPFGAKALIVNMYSNFGLFYPVFIALMGAYYGFLYKRAHTSIFYRATYFSALPILLLLFYREGLVTIMKVMFFNGLAVPLAVALLMVWLSPRTVPEIRSRIARNRASGDSA